MNKTKYKTKYIVLAIALSTILFQEGIGHAAASNPCGADHRCICDYVNGSDANGTQIITYTPDPECIDCGAEFKVEYDKFTFRDMCTGSDVDDREGRAPTGCDWRNIDVWLEDYEETINIRVCLRNGYYCLIDNLDEDEEDFSKRTKPFLYTSYLPITGDLTNDSKDSVIIGWPASWTNQQIGICYQKAAMRHFLRRRTFDYYFDYGFSWLATDSSSGIGDQWNLFIPVRHWTNDSGNQATVVYNGGDNVSYNCKEGRCTRINIDKAYDDRNVCSMDENRATIHETSHNWEEDRDDHYRITYPSNTSWLKSHINELMCNMIADTMPEQIYFGSSAGRFCGRTKSKRGCARDTDCNQEHGTILRFSTNSYCDTSVSGGQCTLPSCSTDQDCYAEYYCNRGYCIYKGVNPRLHLGRYTQDKVTRLYQTWPCNNTDYYFDYTIGTHVDSATDQTVENKPSIDSHVPQGFFDSFIFSMLAPHSDILYPSQSDDPPTGHPWYKYKVRNPINGFYFNTPFTPSVMRRKIFAGERNVKQYIATLGTGDRVTADGFNHRFIYGMRYGDYPNNPDDIMKVERFASFYALFDQEPPRSSSTTNYSIASQDDLDPWQESMHLKQLEPAVGAYRLSTTNPEPVILIPGLETSNDFISSPVDLDRYTVALPTVIPSSQPQKVRLDIETAPQNMSLTAVTYTETTVQERYTRTECCLFGDENTGLCSDFAQISCSSVEQKVDKNVFSLEIKGDCDSTQIDGVDVIDQRFRIDQWGIGRLNGTTVKKGDCWRQYSTNREDGGFRTRLEYLGPHMSHQEIYQIVGSSFHIGQDYPPDSINDWYAKTYSEQVTLHFTAIQKEDATNYNVSVQYCVCQDEACLNCNPEIGWLSQRWYSLGGATSAFQYTFQPSGSIIQNVEFPVTSRPFIIRWNWFQTVAKDWYVGDSFQSKFIKFRYSYTSKEFVQDANGWRNELDANKVLYDFQDGNKGYRVTNPYKFHEPKTIWFKGSKMRNLKRFWIEPLTLPYYDFFVDTMDPTGPVEELNPTALYLFNTYLEEPIYQGKLVPKVPGESEFNLTDFVSTTGFLPKETQSDDGSITSSMDRVAFLWGGIPRDFPGYLEDTGNRTEPDCTTDDTCTSGTLWVVRRDQETGEYVYAPYFDQPPAGLKGTVGGHIFYYADANNQQNLFILGGYRYPYRINNTHMENDGHLVSLNGPSSTVVSDNWNYQTAFSAEVQIGPKQYLLLGGEQKIFTTQLTKIVHYLDLSGNKPALTLRPDLELPESMADMAAGYNPVTREVYIFGGRTYTGSPTFNSHLYFDSTPLDGFYKIDLDDPSQGWQKIDCTEGGGNSCPSARYAAALMVNEVTGKIMLWGGITSGDSDQNEVWSWDGEDWSVEILPGYPQGDCRNLPVNRIENGKLCRNRNDHWSNPLGHLACADETTMMCDASTSDTSWHGSYLTIRNQNAFAVVPQSKKAYIGTDWGLDVVYVGLDYAPVRLGWMPTNGPIVDLAVRDRYSYHLDYDGLNVFDLNLDVLPIRIGQAELALGQGRALELLYPFVFAISQVSLEVFKVDDPEHPARVFTMPLGQSLTDIAVKDGKAYISDFDGIHVLDISNPTAPFVWDFVETTTPLVKLRQDGDFLYGVSRSDEKITFRIGDRGFIYSVSDHNVDNWVNGSTYVDDEVYWAKGHWMHIRKVDNP